jgi:hypothetical protein
LEALLSEKASDAMTAKALKASEVIRGPQEKKNTSYV